LFENSKSGLDALAVITTSYSKDSEKIGSKVATSIAS